MKKHIIWTLVLVVTILSMSGQSNEATATSFSVFDNNPGSTLVSGATYNGSFDITAQLPSISSIMTATATFSFSDNPDSRSFQGGSISGWYNSSNSYWRYWTSYYNDPFEASQVTISDQASNGSSTYFDTGTIYQGYSSFSQNWFYSCGFFGSTCYGGTNYFYTYYYDQTSGHNGLWQVGMNLGAAGLAELSTGTLNFAIAPTGNFMFDDAQLNVTYNANAVPESSTLLLLGLGLVGLAAWRLKKSA